MPMPKGTVLYANPIPVIGSNNNQDAIKPWSQFSIPGYDQAPSNNGFLLESTLQDVEAIDGGLFKVTETGEVFKPIDGAPTKGD